MTGYSGTPLPQKLGIKPGLNVVTINAPRNYRRLLGTIIADTGTVWVSWPKRSSGVHTDVTEDVVRDVALPLGFVDVKVCAIDEIWSGLKLMVRRTNRKLPPIKVDKSILRRSSS